MRLSLVLLFVSIVQCSTLILPDGRTAALSGGGVVQPFLSPGGDPTETSHTIHFGDVVLGISLVDRPSGIGAGLGGGCLIPANCADSVMGFSNVYSNGSVSYNGLRYYSIYVVGDSFNYRFGGGGGSITIRPAAGGEITIPLQTIVVWQDPITYIHPFTGATRISSQTFQIYTITPEPGTWMTVGSLMAVALYQRRQRKP